MGHFPALLDGLKIARGIKLVKSAWLLWGPAKSRVRVFLRWAVGCVRVVFLTFWCVSMVLPSLALKTCVYVKKIMLLRSLPRPMQPGVKLGFSKVGKQGSQGAQKTTLHGVTQCRKGNWFLPICMVTYKYCVARHRCNEEQPPLYKSNHMCPVTQGGGGGTEL